MEVKILGLGVLGDAALTLDALRAALEATGPARPVRREEFEAIKEWASGNGLARGGGCEDLED